MKYGKVKREHSRVGGLDGLLDRIMRDCPGVTRIVPGRITRRRGKTPGGFKVQYPTQTGLKCLFTGTGTIQEVFIVTSDQAGVQKWLKDKELID